jgi:hypothetical protein
VTELDAIHRPDPGAKPNGHVLRCDGTEDGAVHDVAEFDFKTPITVIATYENGVHTLRPVGFPIVVTRHLEGELLVWKYLTFTARLKRVRAPQRADGRSQR